MHCNEIRELISCMLDGELTPAESAMVTDHIAGCPDCMRAFEAFHSLSLVMEEQVEPPGDFTAQVMERVHAQAASPAPKRKPRVLRYLAMAACLAVVLLAGTGITDMYRGGGANNGAGTQPQTAEYKAPANRPRLHEKLRLDTLFQNSSDTAADLGDTDTMEPSTNYASPETNTDIGESEATADPTPAGPGLTEDPNVTPVGTGLPDGPFSTATPAPVETGLPDGPTPTPAGTGQTDDPNSTPAGTGQTDDPNSTSVGTGLLDGPSPLLALLEYDEESEPDPTAYTEEWDYEVTVTTEEGERTLHIWVDGEQIIIRDADTEEIWLSTMTVEALTELLGPIE